MGRLVIVLAALCLASSLSTAVAQERQPGEASRLDGGAMFASGTWELTAAPEQDPSRGGACVNLNTEVDRDVPGLLPGLPATETRGEGLSACEDLPAPRAMSRGMVTRRCDGGSTFVFGLAGRAVRSAATSGPDRVAVRFYRHPAVATSQRVYLLHVRSTRAVKAIVARDRRGRRIGRLNLSIPACESTDTNR